MVVQQLVNFCAVDLSALYLDIVKDRLYTFGATTAGRRAAQTVLFDVVDALVRLMAPILSFTADEIWRYIPRGERTESVLLAGFPNDLSRDDALAARWERLLEVRSAVTKALEEARQSGLIGHSLEAHVDLHAADGLRPMLEGAAQELPALFIVSQVALGADLGPEYISPLLPELKVKVEKARGGKCERCWNYSVAVGRDAVHPTVCERCLPVITALGS
jgi:isoleucyl-tRNA synthetase